MSKRDYCFELKSRLSELNTLCRHLEDCGSVMGLPQKCLFEINLGLDELFTNIISYGFEDEAEHQIKFSLAEAAGPAAPEDPDDLDSIDIGGLGIHLVKKMMDDIDYQRVKGRNRLILKKCVATA